MLVKGNDSDSHVESSHHAATALTEEGTAGSADRAGRDGSGYGVSDEAMWSLGGANLLIKHDDFFSERKIVLVFFFNT